MSATNIFIGSYLPGLFWPAQIATFGSSVVYWPQGDSARAVSISVLWKEGATDEEMSPGRYSHMDIQNSDIPLPLNHGDIVQKDQKLFLVVRVAALAVGYSTIVLQEKGPVL